MADRMKLKDRLSSLAERYDIELEISYGNRFEIEILAPDGYQFMAETHSLVCSQWDDDSPAQLYRAAIKLVQCYGPRLAPCPEKCTCKEIDEDRNRQPTATKKM